MFSAFLSLLIDLEITLIYLLSVLSDRRDFVYELRQFL